MPHTRPHRSAKAAGDCYEASFNEIMKHPPGELRLAHGTCTGQGPIKGVTFGHSWLECGPIVFNVANGAKRIVLKETYYKAGACRNVALYTKDEAICFALEFGHYGPWDEDTKKVAHFQNKPLTRTKALGSVAEVRKNRP